MSGATRSRAESRVGPTSDHTGSVALTALPAGQTIHYPVDVNLCAADFGANENSAACQNRNGLVSVRRALEL